MLDSWIIEDLLRRERVQQDEPPLLELPLFDIPPAEADQKVRDEEKKRGVVVVDFIV